MVNGQGFTKMTNSLSGINKVMSTLLKSRIHLLVNGAKPELLQIQVVLSLVMYQEIIIRSAVGLTRLI